MITFKDFIKSNLDFIINEDLRDSNKIVSKWATYNVHREGIDNEHIIVELWENKPEWIEKNHSDYDKGLTTEVYRGGRCRLMVFNKPSDLDLSNPKDLIVNIDELK